MHHKISLPVAIIINLNIMLSAGIFLNSIPLAQYAGGLSPLTYIIIGSLLIPLIISIALLMNYHVQGNFYSVAAQELHPLLGFASIWSYFFAKPASAALMIHFFSDIMRQVFPTINGISHISLDIIVIIVFVMLNLLNMQIGKSIQVSFVAIKAIPIFAIILIGIWFLQPANFAPINLRPSGIIIGLPLALFAFAGFEATLSISKHIENAQRNAPFAIMLSYIIAVTISVLYQFGYYAASNLHTLSTNNYFQAIVCFLTSVFHQIHPTLVALLSILVSISALGGAYGIMFSNKWNLYTLAQHKHVFFHNSLLKMNRAGIAYWCLFVEACIILTYITSTGAHQIILQHISAFGCTTSYTISVISFAMLVFFKLKKTWLKVLAILALINCALLLSSCINGFIIHSPAALYIFGIMMAFGILMYLYTQKSTRKIHGNEPRF
jgi:amino acid transporter